MNNKVILFDSKKDCCGCSACMNICPKHAIDMMDDIHGFLYPIIDEKKCIKCKLCKKVCGYQNYDISKYTNQEDAYVGVWDNNDILNSASGGIFGCLANNIINEGGIVYGASMENCDGSLKVMHIGIETKDQLYKLQGSKYVQSNINNVYKEVKRNVETGRIVLFSGTPCQIDGLNSYIGNKQYDNLLTIDIICHGVPNVRMFQDYIKIIEKRTRYKVKTFVFRDKKVGWGYNGKATFEGENGQIKEKIIYAGESSYYKLFLASEIHRENCYSCKYSNMKRVSDITIGDYWGIEKEHPELITQNKIDKFRGISGILVNTQHGKKCINKYSINLNLYPTERKKIANHNRQLLGPSKMGYNRDKILKLYETDGYNAIERWFNRKNLLKLTLIKLRNRVKNIKNYI